MELLKRTHAGSTETIRAFFIGLTVLAGLAAARPNGPMADPALRQQYGAALRQKAQERRQAAWRMASEHGWQPRWQHGQTVYDLQAVAEDHIYVYKTCNANARISIAVDRVQGFFPYYLSGQGVLVGIWDGGSVLTSHQELLGRVTVRESASLSSHATHVAGTIGAAGARAQAKGMAPQVQMDSYYFDSDTSEMTVRAMSYSGEPGTLAISNHSYGLVSGWDHSASTPRWYGLWGYRESDWFGKYIDETQEWDRICYNAPYYLPVKAMGNDRDDPAPAEGETFEYYSGYRWRTKAYDSATDPYRDGWDDGGFDTTMPVSCAKNILTVGAVTDAVLTGQRDPSRAAVLSFSGWGPTDDGRIKPDVVTNGYSVYSSITGSNSSYAYYSGTSMAAPSASGAAALLTEYHKNLFNNRYLRSAGLKGLLIHTADDLGRPGLDYTFGWGLINTQRAVELLLNQADFPDRPILVEQDLLASEGSDVYTMEWSGFEPIRATLCWTDPPGSEQTALDDRTPRLVNDLDLRIYDSSGAVYEPFVLDVLNPDLAAGRGDNIRDNVEQVLIGNPQRPGQYTVVVSRKGGLVDQRQAYTLILSGHRLTPPVVSGLTAAAGPDCGRVELNWTPAADADGYIVLYQEASGQPPFLPDTDGWPASGSDLGNVTSVTVSGLDPLSTYYFTVQPYNSRGVGDPAAAVTARPDNGCFVDISGTVMTLSGYGIPGVTVSVLGRPYETLTGPDGAYSLAVPLEWAGGTVEVSKQQWEFEPSQRTYGGPVLSPFDGQDYVGSRRADFGIDGLVALEDLNVLASWWQADCAASGDCGQADLDLSGTVNLVDLELFIEQWLSRP